MRKTYCEVNLGNLKNNVERIINNFTDYSYYFGVVKADCYGHGIECIQYIIDGGCNYLAVVVLRKCWQSKKHPPQHTLHKYPSKPFVIQF